MPGPRTRRRAPPAWRSWPATRPSNRSWLHQMARGNQCLPAFTPTAPAEASRTGRGAHAPPKDPTQPSSGRPNDPATELYQRPVDIGLGRRRRRRKARARGPPNRPRRATRGLSRPSGRTPSNRRAVGTRWPETGTPRKSRPTPATVPPPKPSRTGRRRRTPRRRLITTAVYRHISDVRRHLPI